MRRRSGIGEEIDQGIYAVATLLFLPVRLSGRRG